MAMIPMISVMKVEKLMRDRYEAYLVFVTTDEGSKRELSEVPIVQDFQEIFPNELLGLPPRRGAEFTIDLLPSTQPISKAPYRMTPNELKELKAQLEELIEKILFGQVHPRGCTSIICEEERLIFKIMY